MGYKKKRKEEKAIGKERTKEISKRETKKLKKRKSVNSGSV